MQFTEKQEIPCPHCRQTLPVEILRAVNGHEQPELREKILNNTIFDHRCPHCREVFQLAHPLLYIDKDNEMMVWLTDCQAGNIRKLNSDLAANPDLLPSFGFGKRRAVPSIYDLIEKIHIFEAGYDDRIMEMLKYAHLLTLPKDRYEQIQFCYYAPPIEQDSALIPFCLGFRDGHTEESGVPPAIYDIFLNRAQDFMQMDDPTDFQVIDYQWVQGAMTEE